MTRRACAAILFCIVSLGMTIVCVSPTAAQQRGVTQSAIVILDRERLFNGSKFGRRILRDIEAAAKTLRDENRRIEASLIEEEGRLTALRSTIDAAEFQTLATEFDTQVEAIRQAQSVKEAALSQQSEQARARFFQAAGPVLQQLARSAGALVVLDRRSVIASVDRIDITDLAIARIDARLGEGETMEALTGLPAAGPETAPTQE